MYLRPLFWFLALGILAPGGGCRTPWRSSNAEPNFDRLIEIEQQSEQRATRRGPLVPRLRPGQDSGQPGTKRSAEGEDQAAILPAAANSMLSGRAALARRKNNPIADDLPGAQYVADASEADASEMEELLVDVPPAQRELLRREMFALNARNRAEGGVDESVPAPHADKDSPTASHSARKNTPARKRFSDLSESETDSGLAADEEDSLPTNAIENGESDLAPGDYTGSSKYPLAAQDSNRQRRGNNPKAQLPEENYSRKLTDDASEVTSRPQQATDMAQRSLSTADGVVTASHAEASKKRDKKLSGLEADAQHDDELDWRQHIAAAISQLEGQPTGAGPEENVHRQMVDRLLHLSLGDIEAASEPIEGLQTDGQDFIRHSLKSLFEVSNPTGNPVEIKRYTLAMLSQRQALSHLAAASNLEVHNATFCTEVDSFGVVTKFPQYVFTPDQELLLYCELDNFVSTHIEGKGYETQLQGSYEIFDSNGQRIADQHLPLDSHQCRNQRRDYFIAYRIYTPKEIKSGKYQLKLTVQDMKGRKFGQATLDFQIQ